MSMVYLEDGRLIILPEVVREDVGVHQCPPTLAQDVQALPQELNLQQSKVT